ncbi:hypothetical protein LINPERPRIM_LOCUS34583 [Linum perenne]
MWMKQLRSCENRGFEFWVLSAMSRMQNRGRASLRKLLRDSGKLT